jgi:hypothetical protein
MTKLRFTMSISLDGFVAGPDQTVENPLGIGGEQLHDWVVPLEPGENRTGCRRRDQCELDGARGDPGPHRRHDHGPEHVRRAPGTVGPGRAVGRLVGRQPAVPSPGVRADPPRSSPAPSSGRDHVYVRDRWDRVGPAPGAGRGRRHGHCSGGRRQGRATVPGRGAGGSDGSEPGAGLPWPRGATVRESGEQSAAARVGTGGAGARRHSPALPVGLSQPVTRAGRSWHTTASAPRPPERLQLAAAPPGQVSESGNILQLSRQRGCHPFEGVRLRGPLAPVWRPSIRSCFSWPVRRKSSVAHASSRRRSS